jgi:hypothetical protein
MGCFNPGAGVAAGGPFVPIGGGTMTGLLILSGNPAAALGAATKQYVDSAVSGGPFLPLAGGSMGGPITQPTAPVAGTDLTNKAYVDTGDAAVAAAGAQGPFAFTAGLTANNGYVTAKLNGVTYKLQTTA